MKVGDKVLVEVEVKRIDKLAFQTTENDVFGISEAITQLPIQEGRWMMVSQNGVDWITKYVTHKHGNLFRSNFPDGDRAWVYAKEIPIKRKLTMQEIAEKFNEDVENIEIECQK